MASITLKNWIFNYDSDNMMIISNDEKIIFLTKEYDEIHLVIEIEAGLLVFHPRWSTKITHVNDTTYLIESNN